MEYEYDRDYEEACDEIVAEHQEFAENMCRSDEEGWFYPDGDETNDES